ncbi:MAG: flagellar hook-basal body complex protein [Planctomycetes bacterium]|nr:flagellar hook-basal body complex protein [Planctomycetota bacterium]
MSSSLFSALSGLQAHQSWIDVIGNNLANSNTPGFKSSAATFSDQFARTLQYASGPGTGRGGRNPVQIGLGVRLADTSHNFSQGALTRTGRTFDVAMQGNGFFAVSNGVQNLYTRVGTFGLDALHQLVDQRTGFPVLSPTGQPIEIDTESLLAPNATTSARLSGNLPKVVTGPLPEVLTASSAFAQGSPAQLTSSNSGPFTIPAGETWTMRVTVAGGAPQTVSVTSVTGSVTATDIATAVDALDDVSATVNGSGQLEITTDRAGENVTLKVSSGSTGRDLAALTGLSTALVSGSQTDATSTTDLSELPGNVVDYIAGDRIHVTGVDADGTAINAEFTYGAGNDGTTVDDFVNFVDALYAGATVTMDAAGKLTVESDTAGESGLQLSLLDDSSNTGSVDWTTYAMAVTTEGTASDEVSTSMEVFDSAGVAHTMTMTFARQQDGSWSLTPSLSSADGSVLSGSISGLLFDDDGAPLGLAGVDPTVQVQFAGQTSPQTITFDLGSDGAFTGLTQFGSEGEVFVREQDGYGVGELASMSVDADGMILGLYTNGKTQDLGQMGVATFVNPEGLQLVGNNLYSQTVNSGAVNLGVAEVGAAGSVIGGSLENSNVDTAEQFVALIQAQRGFQANARVITAENEVLRDTVNLI